MRNVSYQYDPVGNRSQVTDNGNQTGYTANNLNQYSIVDGCTFSYDNNGNLVSAVGPAPLGGYSYQYDAQNRLVSVAQASVPVATFAYDARNRCVARTINSVTTYLAYDVWSLLEELDTNGTEQARYIHGAMIDEILLRTTATNTVYYHHDGLGSNIALTDATGALVESYQYDVFGSASILNANYQLLTTSAVGNRFLFTGREWLPDVGLYDYRNRFYSPVLGRFLQTDPKGLSADVNLYRYVRGNPPRLNDPFGFDGIFEAIGAFVERVWETVVDTVSKVAESGAQALSSSGGSGAVPSPVTIAQIPQNVIPAGYSLTVAVLYKQLTDCYYKYGLDSPCCEPIKAAYDKAVQAMNSVNRAFGK